jgi:hypothetical protein
VRGQTAKEIAAATRAEFKRYRDRLLKHIRYLDYLIEHRADMLQLDPAVLRQQREVLQEIADRITTQLRSHSWVYFGILEAAALAGIDLGYTSPVEAWTAQAQKEERPFKPHGPGIDYLIAAAAAHGYVIGPDRARDLLATFNKLPALRTRFGGAGKMVAVVQVWDKDGNEVLDDANRPKP